jgi:hypothetical protein
MSDEKDITHFDTQQKTNYFFSSLYMLSTIACRGYFKGGMEYQKRGPFFQPQHLCIKMIILWKDLRIRGLIIV